MVVHPSFPAKTVPGFVAYAQANPGKTNFALWGNGTPPHVVGELFKMMAGVNLVHCPTAAARLQWPTCSQGRCRSCSPRQAFRSDISGRASCERVAVTTATRSAALPDMPTVGDFLAGFEASVWLGIGAPKNTPAEIIEKLNKEVNAALADPKIKGRLTDLGSTVLGGSPSDCGSLIADETEKRAEVIRAANIKAE